MGYWNSRLSAAVVVALANAGCADGGEDTGAAYGPVMQEPAPTISSSP